MLVLILDMGHNLSFGERMLPVLAEIILARDRIRMHDVLPEVHHHIMAVSRGVDLHFSNVFLVDNQILLRDRFVKYRAMSIDELLISRGNFLECPALSEEIQVNPLVKRVAFIIVVEILDCES